jgi:hypothetical protein
MEVMERNCVLCCLDKDLVFFKCCNKKNSCCIDCFNKVKNYDNKCPYCRENILKFKESSENSFALVNCNLNYINQSMELLQKQDDNGNDYLVFLKNFQTQLYNLQHKVSRLIKHRPFNTDNDDNDLEIAINQIQDHHIYNPFDQDDDDDDQDDDDDDQDDDDDDQDDDQDDDDQDDDFIDDDDDDDQDDEGDDDIDIHINERIIHHYHTHEIILGDQVLNSQTQEQQRNLLADIFAFTFASSFQNSGG